MNNSGGLGKPRRKIREGKVVTVNLVSIEAKSCGSSQPASYITLNKGLFKESLTLETLEGCIDFFDVLSAKLPGVRFFILEVSP